MLLLVDQPAHKQKLTIHLTALHTATVIQDITLPGFRLLQLKGKVILALEWRYVFQKRTDVRPKVG